MHRIILLSLFVFGWSVASWADVIIFSNGDQLTGKLVELKEGKLTFESDVVGSVTIDIADIRNFSTNDSVSLHFDDGTVIKSKILGIESDNLQIEKTKLPTARTIALDDLVAINPPAKPKPKWTGSITVSLASTHGNTFTDSADISFDITRRLEKDRTNFYGSYAGGSSKDSNNIKKTTEENFQIGGKYDYFFNKKLYGYLSGSYEKDRIANLDYRTIGGIGFGYQWVERDDIKFATDAGFAQLNERNTIDAVTTDKEEASLQFGYDLKWKFAKNLTFLHAINYYPSLEKFSDYLLTADVEIKASITNSMFSSFKAVFDYNAIPADGVGTTDIKYTLGIGWNF